MTVIQFDTSPIGTMSISELMSKYPEECETLIVIGMDRQRDMERKRAIKAVKAALSSRIPDLDLLTV
jgi:hypothetical protein